MGRFGGQVSDSCVPGHALLLPGKRRVQASRPVRAHLAHPRRPLHIVKPLQDQIGGGGGIRTHETRERLPVFKTGAFNHSATPPVCHSDDCAWYRANSALASVQSGLAAEFMWGATTINDRCWAATARINAILSQITYIAALGIAILGD